MKGGGKLIVVEMQRPSEPNTAELTAPLLGGSTPWGSSPTQLGEIPTQHPSRYSLQRTLIGSIPAGALIARPTGRSPSCWHA
jgi:hypothetical protein